MPVVGLVQEGRGLRYIAHRLVAIRERRGDRNVKALYGGVQMAFCTFIFSWIN